MNDRNRTDEIAVLEQVREQLEARLHADHGTARDGRLTELGDSAVYKSLRLVNEAINNLRSINDETGADSGGRAKLNDKGAPDDLTSIRGINAAVAGHLAALGITQYAEIASWRAADVRSVSQALGLTREISRQNWIEQAALLDRRKQSSKEEAPTSGPIVTTLDCPATVQQTGIRVAQWSLDRLELPEIIQAIRQEGVASENLSSPTVPEPASTIPGEPTDAIPESPGAGAEVHAVPAQTGAAAAVGGQQDVARAKPPIAAQTLSTPQGSRIPSVAASAHVNTDAIERARRLEEARQRLARNAAELADGERLRDVDEAAVAFVVREPAIPQQQTGPPTHVRSLSLPNPFDGTRKRDSSMVSYVASKDPAEEAEVVVVKPQTYYGSPKSCPVGPLQRLLKALRGS